MYVDGLGFMLILDAPSARKKAVQFQISFSGIKFHLYILFFKFTLRERIFCKCMLLSINSYSSVHD